MEEVPFQVAKPMVVNGQLFGAAALLKKSNRRLNHRWITENPPMAQPFGGHEAGGGPSRGNGFPIGPRHFTISPVVDQQHGCGLARREAVEANALGWEACAPGIGCESRRVFGWGKTQQGQDLVVVGVGFGGRCQEDHALHLDAVIQGDGRARGAQRMGDDPVDGSKGVHQMPRRLTPFQRPTAAPLGAPMARLIEGEDGETSLGQRFDEGMELGTTAFPPVKAKDRGALTPGVTSEAQAIGIEVEGASFLSRDAFDVGLSMSTGAGKQALCALMSKVSRQEAERAETQAQGLDAKIGRAMAGHDGLKAWEGGCLARRRP